MQLCAPIMAMLSLIITMGQEDLFSMIVKSYVTMGAICQIANQFAATLPKEVFENARILNDSGILKIGTDNNSTDIILKRLYQAFLHK